MIFEKMPTAAKVMLLAMFHNRDGFRSFGMIHLMSYTIASTATTVRDNAERTAARRLSERSGNGFPARDRPVFRNARQPSSCASQRHVSRRGSRGRTSPSGHRARPILAKCPASRRDVTPDPRIPSDRTFVRNSFICRIRRARVLLS